MSKILNSIPDSIASLHELRSRPKVHVESCVDGVNMADQSCQLDMSSILRKFHAGEPLGVSGRANYYYDQVLAPGDSIDKPIERTPDLDSRFSETGDVFVAMKRLDRKIKEAAKASVKGKVVSEPVNEPVAAGEGLASPKGAAVSPDSKSGAKA